MPIRGEHVHFWLTEAEIPKSQAWYAKPFGGKAGTRNYPPEITLWQSARLTPSSGIGLDAEEPRLRISRPVWPHRLRW
jgi:hypothetical protein